MSYTEMPEWELRIMGQALGVLIRDRDRCERRIAELRRLIALDDAGIELPKAYVDAVLRPQKKGTA